MPLSCHSALRKVKSHTDYTFALAGNPNVGKSTIFNRLTGTGVVTANYPGKTVEVNIATTTLDSLHIGIVDLPGTYAIGAISEDQWVARQAVIEGKPDVVVMIVDATNLSRNLYMVLQFIDLGLPVVVALNLIDQAEKDGLVTDSALLSELLAVPVIPTVATLGTGLDELMRAAVEVAKNGSALIQRSPRYGSDIEEPIARMVARLNKMCATGESVQELADGRHCQSGEGKRFQHRHGSSKGLVHSVPSRALAILLLEEDPQFVSLARKESWGSQALDKSHRLSAEIERKHGERASLRLARERHGLAGTIASEVQKRGTERERRVDRIWRYTTSPFTGIPILFLVLAGIFAFLFFVGNILSTLFSSFWAAYVSPPIDGTFYYLFGKGMISNTLIWGFDAGIQAALAVGIPYVLTFYFLLAFLEDTGYLNSAAFLTDRVMHRFGLHGRAIIPIVAGAGCNVPAIIGTRVLSTMRERVIASTLIVLVPCSARTAVILGAVSAYVGWQPAVGIFLITLALIAAVGLGLNLVMPGQSTGLVMEMFPFRAPSAAPLLKKTWHRFKDFVFVATPIVLVGSLTLGALYETGYLWKLASPLSPIVEGWLGLPAVAGLTLIFAVLRKELALQLLVTLAIVSYGREATNLLKFMNPNQLFVYALVNTIYIPCVATIAVLGRELGWKRAIAIMTFTIALAILIGGIVFRLTELF
jgi:ferrous iron transport protein B